MWSFFWSSIRISVLLVGICSFLVLICREGRWISWTRNHTFHHGLGFSVSLLLLLFTHYRLPHQRWLMVFHWSLWESKFPQVPMNLLNIFAVLNNSVVWMVSTRPPTSKWSSLFNNPLVTVPKAPITIGIIVINIFHSFFQISSKVEVLILLFTLFQF